MLHFFSILLALPLLAASTWTLDSERLEQNLPLGVTSEELLRVLKKEGIEISLQEPNKIGPLWRAGPLTISLANPPIAPYHLLVSLEGRKSLEECTPDELIALYEAVGRGRKAIREVSRASSFMIFTTESPRCGNPQKNIPSVTFEILPSGFSSSCDPKDLGVMDAVEKSRLNDYAFYNKFIPQFISHSPEEIGALRQKLAASPFEKGESETLEKKWTQKMIRHKEALHQSVADIYHLLTEKGILIGGELPPFTPSEDKIHEIEINLDKCAFCNPQVIEKQRVIDWGEVEILMGHKPVSPYGNFLILPKRHQCSWDLTSEEALASFDAIIALRKMFSQTVGLQEWICYIQDGPAAGQTVPHTHIHFYLLPDPLKMAITTLQHIHNDRPILSPEALRAQCDTLKPLLLSEKRER